MGAAFKDLLKSFPIVEEMNKVEKRIIVSDIEKGLDVSVYLDRFEQDGYGNVSLDGNWLLRSIFIKYGIEIATQCKWFSCERLRKIDGGNNLGLYLNEEVSDYQIRAIESGLSVGIDLLPLAKDGCPYEHLMELVILKEKGIEPEEYVQRIRNFLKEDAHTTPRPINYICSVLEKLFPDSYEEISFETLKQIVRDELLCDYDPNFIPEIEHYPGYYWREMYGADDVFSDIEKMFSKSKEVKYRLFRGTTIDASDKFLVYGYVRDFSCYKSDFLLEMKHNSVLEMAHAGDPVAQYELAKMLDDQYEDKMITDKDAALGWYKKSAEQGNLDAQYSMGAKLLRSNPSLAAHYFRMAADHGCSKSKYKLALMFIKGKGVEKDLNQAIQLFVESSEVEAKVALGKIYYSGYGVEENKRTALKMWTIAAESGDVAAQCTIGEMYLKGDGIQKDIVLAKKYLGMAKKGGSRRAKVLLDSIK